MAKKSMIQRDLKRIKLNKSFDKKRQDLKEKMMDKEISLKDRIQIMSQLSKIPRNSAKCRQRNRCGVTGRPRAYYRKFGLSRIVLRDLASSGLIPGLKKSSW